MEEKNSSKQSASKITKALRATFGTKKAFHKNVVRANKFTNSIILLSAAVIAVIWALGEYDFYYLPEDVTLPLMISSLVLLMIPWCICQYFHGSRDWLKNMLIPCMIIAYAIIDIFPAFRGTLLMAIPLILSSRYCNRRFTVFTSIFAALVFLGSTFFGIMLEIIDLNYIAISPGTAMTVTSSLANAVAALSIDMKAQALLLLLRSYLPKLLTAIIVGYISVKCTERKPQKKAAKVTLNVKKSDFESKYFPEIAPEVPAGSEEEASDAADTESEIIEEESEITEEETSEAAEPDTEQADAEEDISDDAEPTDAGENVSEDTEQADAVENISKDTEQADAEENVSEDIDQPGAETEEIEAAETESVDAAENKSAETGQADASKTPSGQADANETSSEQIDANENVSEQADANETASEQADAAENNSEKAENDTADKSADAETEITLIEFNETPQSPKIVNMKQRQKTLRSKKTKWKHSKQKPRK